MRGDSRSGAKRAAGGASASRPADAVMPEDSSPAGQEPPKGADEPLRLVHHHPGYLRIRAAAFRQPETDNSFATSARTAAEETLGFRSWSLNPRTGSVVIKYEPGALEADDLLNHIAKRAGFQGVETSTRGKTDRRELVSSFLDGVQQVNRTVGELTGERADLRELVPAALVAVSVVSFLVNDERGRLPHWFGALYRSYRIFYQWHRREIRTRERAARHAQERGGPEEHTGDSP